MSSPPSRPELLALLTAAREAPDDFTPRFVLADWLEDHGDADDRARAEALRLALRSLRGESVPAGRASFLRRQHAPRWLGGLASRATWIRHGPWLDHLQMEAGVVVSRAVQAARAEEAWVWTGELDVRGADARAAPRLAACPLLEDLIALNFPSGALGTAGVQALARSPRLGGRHLDLDSNQLDAAGVSALVRAPGLGALTSLNLSANALGIAGALALADTPTLGRLTELYLAHCEIPPGGAVALLRSPKAAGLRTLVLSDNLLGPADVRALVESPHLAGLRSLTVWGNPLGPGAAEALRTRFGLAVSVALP